MDSLLYRYSYITHSNFYGTQIPILNVSTFEKLTHGLCANRCWYNSLLLSSLGMAVVIDFVSAWENRNGSHSWNALIIDGDTYPFDAFWEFDRWKYKRLYNNHSFNKWWGRFRLPKVYRRTFSTHLEGILKDTRVKMEDIPELFKDTRKIDVSHEYFDTINVVVELK